MPVITIGPYNTVPILAASGVYRLTWQATFMGSFGPVPAIGLLDVMNIGGGTVFLRADMDPAANDLSSLTLPPNSAANSLKIDGGIGLGVIAATDTTITVRKT